MALQIKLVTITIDNVIVHTIPKKVKDADGIEPNYSKRESNLTHGLKLFLKEKIVQALASEKAFKVKFNDLNPSPISYLNKELLDNDGSNFVEISKNIAKHLFDVQSGTNAAGILVCILGSVSSKPACFLLKLEMDKGMQLKLDPETESYDIAEVEDLMLTQKTKIFKVALLIKRQDYDSDFDGKTMDYQIDMKVKKEVTTWFIEKFLGCTAYDEPKVTTQKFYNLTRSFIDTIEEPIERAKYIQDLNSYVQKNVSQISAQEFADDYMTSIESKSKYKSFLESKSFSMSSFHKDTAQISRQIQKIVITFENEISITGPNGSFEDKVDLEKLDNGQTRAIVTSRVRKIV